MAGDFEALCEYRGGRRRGVGAVRENDGNAACPRFRHAIKGTWGASFIEAAMKSSADTNRAQEFLAKAQGLRVFAFREAMALPLDQEFPCTFR